MGAGTGLRMPLKAKGILVGTMDALQTAIEQGLMSDAQIVGKRVFIHGKTVILTGNQHSAIIQVLHRMIRTVMAEFHFHRGGATGQTQQLVPQTDTEYRNSRLQNFLDGSNGIGTGLGITRPIGQKYPIGIQGQHLGRWRLGRDDRQAATAVDQHPQYIALNAKIVGYNMPGELSFRAFSVTYTKLPAAFTPGITCLYRDLFSQVHTFETGVCPRLFQRLGFINILASDQTTVLSTFLPQNTGQAARVYIGDSHNAAAAQVILQALLIAVIAGQQG